MTNQEFLDKIIKKQKLNDFSLDFFMPLVITWLIVIPLNLILPFNIWECTSFTLGISMLIQIIGRQK